MEDPLSFRRATAQDVPQIVCMLADDPLGSQREQVGEPLSSTYYEAFHAIAADANNELVVAEAGHRVLATLQVTFIPYLTYQGSWRALIEGVRVSSSARGRGVGRALLEWAIAHAHERGCHMVQLTTDRSRPEAKHFYESLGFKASHEGMKLHLADAAKRR